MSSQWNILFVDDDRDFLDAQAAYFGSRGHTVHTVESSQEALDLLETVTPDIIFLDLMMERYDSGFRLAYEIRKHEHLDGTPLIMLSGVAAETGERFDQEGSGTPQLVASRPLRRQTGHRQAAPRRGRRAPGPKNGLDD